MKSLFIVFCFAFCFIAAAPVMAGFNETMDVILEQDSLTYGAASFLILSGAGVLDDGATLEESALRMGELAPKVVLASDEPVTLGQYSYMIMTVYSIKGGIFYSLFKNPHYSLRELRFQNIVQGKAYPRMTLSGERAVRILSRVISVQEPADEE